MSEILIFSVGAVLFVLTTGATVTFGLYRAHELQVEDMERSDRIANIEGNRLTEIYRTQRVADDDAIPTTQ